MTNKNILIVDDEPYNVKILERLLKEAGYTTYSAQDGAVAWDFLQKNPKLINVILLDRMMPRMNGIELMHKINQHPVLKDIPVIMQTAAASPKEVVEGVGVGVYYYLTKPFEEKVMLAIVHSAIEDAEHNNKLKRSLQENTIALGGLTMAQFKIRTLQEAYNISYFLANFFPIPKKVVPGIYALILNALEHGNLGIGKAKAQLIEQGAWQKEIARRLEFPEHKDKQVEIRYGRDEHEIKLYISDDGQGFNWQEYISVDPARVVGTTGRGIIKACTLSFDEVEYLGNGSEVLCTVKS